MVTKEVKMPSLYSKNENDILYNIPGGKELLEWAEAPLSFHDAEVLSLHLNRIDISILRLYTWVNTGKADEKGYFIQDKHVVVDFNMKTILDISINEFSPQNVIGGLQIMSKPAGELVWGLERIHGIKQKSSIYEVIMEPIYGLHGNIKCQEIEISFTPGKLA